MKIFNEKVLDPRLSLNYATYFFSLLLFSYLLATLGLFIGQSISFVYFPLSIILSSALFIYRSKNLRTFSNILIHLVVLKALLAIAYFICIGILDTSYDGLWYHQPAIIKLAGGWNPVYQHSYEINQYDKLNYMWILHYPKSAWIVGACIYKTSGLIESAKLTNFITAFCVFFYAYHVFSSLFKKQFFYSMVVSLLVSLNPVTISQLLSNYVDGIVSGMFSLIILSLLNMELQKNGTTKWNWLILGGAILIVTNLKFSGLVMSGVIIGIFSLYWWWKKEDYKIILKKYFWIASIAFTSFFVVGFNPYVSNLINHGHLFYPLNVKNQYAVLEQNEPLVLRGRNTVGKFLISLSSETINNIKATTVSWKNPFTVSKKDVRAFAGTDVRIAGLGPLFLLALILSILTFLLNLGRMDRKYKVMVLILTISILLSVLTIPLAWWARYTPQFFMVPLLLVAFSLYTAVNNRLKLKKVFAICTVLIFLVNSALIAIPNFAANRIKTQRIKADMTQLKARKTALYINFSNTEFQAIRTRLQEANIKFTDCDTLRTNVKELRSIYNLYGYGPMYNEAN